MDASFSFNVGELSTLEPYLSLGWTGIKIDGFVEHGGNAALQNDARSFDNAYTQLGLRFSSNMNKKFSISGELGWRHVYGNVKRENIVSFREGGDKFSVRGASMNQDSATLGIQGKIYVSERVNLSLNYDGAYGKNSMSHTGSAALSFSF
jgi:outer membrane autotransporter protein